VTEEAIAQAQRSEQALAEEIRISPNVRQGIAHAIAALPERERLIVTLRYFENLSADEVAEVMGLSPETVRRVERRALTVLGKLADSDAAQQAQV
jgi:RNA polymerase sigma factor (sigma-70 family)